MRPSILLIHCHDLGRYLGCYGVPTVDTPNIDRLASEGVLFSNAFCVAPQCSPSRASMFTGRYPHNNGVMGLTHGSFGWDLHSSERHLAAQLKDEGYHTASIGVMHETQRNAEAWGYEYREDLRENAADARTVCDNAVAFLEKQESRIRQQRTGTGTEGSDRPFFLSVGCYEPHRIPGSTEEGYMGFVGDYISPDSRLGVHVPPWLADHEGTRRELAELQGAVRYMDGHIGHVLDVLDRSALRENTLVIFTTDHGIAMPRAKCTCYDPGLEIATVIRLPSRHGWHGGRRIDELIPNVDLMPTICELAGAPVPSAVQGRSWAPLLDGAPYDPHKEIYPELTYHDYYDPVRAVRSDSAKLLAFFSSAPSFMTPTQSWFPRSSPRHPAEPAVAYHPDFELYDLREDPWERFNVFDDPVYAEVRCTLMGELYSHLTSTNDPIINGAVTPPLHDRVLSRLNERKE